MKKGKEWLKEAIKEYAYANYGNRMKIDISGEELDSLINQLDEPEVLSQKLPVIPKFVADYINRKKKGGNSLDGAFSYIKAYGWDDESSYDYEVYKWLDIGSNDETFARAWLDGYEIEKEPKYEKVLRVGEMFFRGGGYKDDVFVLELSDSRNAHVFGDEGEAIIIQSSIGGQLEGVGE